MSTSWETCVPGVAGAADAADKANPSRSIIDLTGMPLSAAPAAPATPGTQVSHDVDTSPTPTDAYCQFQVSGTGDPRDIRADLNSTLFHANADGTNTFLSRALEAH